MLLEKIRTLAEEISGSIIDIRRHLHKNPELSFYEYQTAAFVKSRLAEIGIPFIPIGKTGIVATLKGGKTSDSVIALRADIDALPIEEISDIEYKSQNKGIMHACGHDAHTASLLGTAIILKSLENDFGGTIKFVFQPAEEILPGGARGLIEEGVLKNPSVQSVIGQHVMPSIARGKIGIRSGHFMASMDELYVSVQGKGGHGAQPHENIDSVLIAAHIIVALQQIVSRAANPKIPSVLSFGKVIAEGSTNIIPEMVMLEGTFRTMDEAWREKAHTLMQKLAIGIAESMGAACEFNIRKGYPSLFNNEAQTLNIRKWAEDYLGSENVMEADIWMAAEDFAYYTQHVPATFYLLGTGKRPPGVNPSLHSRTFDIDERVFTQSTGLMAYVALKKLEDLQRVESANLHLRKVSNI